MTIPKNAPCMQDFNVTPKFNKTKQASWWARGSKPGFLRRIMSALQVKA